MQPNDLSHDGISRAGIGLYLAGVCLTASLGGFLFGFDTAVISGTFGFVEEQFRLSKLQVGWFGSSALMGCILGAATAGMLGDRFGRKPILIMAAFLFFISALFSTFPPSFATLIPARLVGGIGVGMASVLVPMYISEVCSAPATRAARGHVSIVDCDRHPHRLLFELAVAVSGGRLSAGTERPRPVALDLDIRSVAGHVRHGDDSRGSVFRSAVDGPRKSPLVGQRISRWRSVGILTKVSGREVAKREMAEIKEALHREEGTLAELFRPGLRTALVVGMGLALFGQLTGVNIVVYYGPTILQQAGFERIGAFQFQVGFGLINLIFTLIALGLIDKIGRRPLLIGGMSVVVLALALTGSIFLVAGGQTAPSGESLIQATAADAVLSQEAGRWVVVVLCLYMACIALSICAVIWVLTSEIYPNRVRGRAISIATMTNWSTNAVSALLFPWYVQAFGMHAGFLTFAAICFVGTVFFWRYVPETKGRSLEEIERSWLTDPSPRPRSANERERK